MSNVNDTIQKYSKFLVPFHSLETFNKFPEQLKLTKQPILVFDTQYTNLILPWIKPIQDRFLDDKCFKVTHQHQGRSVRAELTDTRFIMPLVVNLEDEFDGNFCSISIYRLFPTDLSSVINSFNVDPKKYWVSEMWHVDNEKNNVFKVAIYLTDVLEYEDAPIQYLKNHKEKYFLHRSDKNSSWREFRIENFSPDINEVESVYGKAGTLILFGPNFIHKGNFARSKIRDILTITFSR